MDDQGMGPGADRQTAVVHVQRPDGCGDAPPDCGGARDPLGDEGRRWIETISTSSPEELLALLPQLEYDEHLLSIIHGVVCFEVYISGVWRKETDDWRAFCARHFSLYYSTVMARMKTYRWYCYDLGRPIEEFVSLAAEIGWSKLYYISNAVLKQKDRDTQVDLADSLIQQCRAGMARADIGPHVSSSFTVLRAILPHERKAIVDDAVMLAFQCRRAAGGDAPETPPRNSREWGEALYILAEEFGRVV